MNIGCVILAGGKSTRMGTDKALLKYEGKYFIEQISDELLWFEERIVARGNNCNFSKTIETMWKVIPDFYPDHGPIGGLHAALSTCRSEALFVVTCDMPLVKSELARRLCAVMQTADTGEMWEDMDGEHVEAYDAVISVGDDGKIHPLCGVYRKSVLPILEEQIVSGQNRVMEALKKMRVKYVTIDSSVEAQQLSNINTPKDYEKLNRKN